MTGRQWQFLLGGMFFIVFSFFVFSAPPNSSHDVFPAVKTTSLVMSEARFFLFEVSCRGLHFPFVWDEFTCQKMYS